MREIVNVRKVGGSVVVTLPSSILSEVDIKEGDRVMLETVGKDQINVKRELEEVKDVAVFPSRPEGIQFLLENTAWGYVNMTREVDYIAIYVTEPEQAVKYFGKVKKVMPQEEHETLAREDMEGKQIILLDWVVPLSTLIKLKGFPLRSLRYTSLQKLLKAKTTEDLW